MMYFNQTMAHRAFVLLGGIAVTIQARCSEPTLQQPNLPSAHMASKDAEYTAFEVRGALPPQAQHMPWASKRAAALTIDADGSVKAVIRRSYIDGNLKASLQELAGEGLVERVSRLIGQQPLAPQIHPIVQALTTIRDHVRTTRFMRRWSKGEKAVDGFHKDGEISTTLSKLLPHIYPHEARDEFNAHAHTFPSYPLAPTYIRVHPDAVPAVVDAVVHEFQLRRLRLEEHVKAWRAKHPHIPPSAFGVPKEPKGGYSWNDICTYIDLRFLDPNRDSVSSRVKEAAHTLLG